MRETSLVGFEIDTGQSNLDSFRPYLIYITENSPETMH